MNRLATINIDRGDHLQNPYPPGFKKVHLPNGASGPWAVTNFQLTAADVGLNNLRHIRDGHSRRICPPGYYTKLTCKGKGVVMSDTPAEAHEHRRLYQAAQGHVLLNGLGIGFALQALLRKREVEKVTVIEISSDVIKLVQPSLVDKRIRIINDDALTWRAPPSWQFDAVWHDIWHIISADNKPEMARLRRRYAKRCRWQDCWSSEYL